MTTTNGICISRSGKVFISGGLIIGLIALVFNTVLQVQRKAESMPPNNTEVTSSRVEAAEARIFAVECKISSIEIEMKRIATNQENVLRLLDKIDTTINEIRKLVIERMIKEPK